MRYIVVTKDDITYDEESNTYLIRVPHEYNEQIRKTERDKLEEYYLNPCCFCGPDGWSTYVCDECIKESEENNERMV